MQFRASAFREFFLYLQHRAQQLVKQETLQITLN